jgi:hypothetical protein
MNREPSSSSPTTLQPLSPAQSFTQTQPSDAEHPATLAFPVGVDTAARVVAQLDGLTASFEQANAGQRSFSSPAAGPHADEEGLESYLQRYMQQLTGKNPPSTATEALSTEKNKAVESAPEPTAPQRQPAPAPEDRSSLTAMRELANESARRAMAESSQIQWIVKTRTTYLATKAISLASSTLAVAYILTRSTVALASATALFGIALILSCWFVGLCRKLRDMTDVVA